MVYLYVVFFRWTRCWCCGTTCPNWPAPSSIVSWWAITPQWPALLSPHSSCSGWGTMTSWRHFPRHWPFMRGIQRSPVDSLHKGPVMRSFGVHITILDKVKLMAIWGAMALKWQRPCKLIVYRNRNSYAENVVFMQRLRFVISVYLLGVGNVMSVYAAAFRHND